MMLTSLGLSNSRLLSKLELATVADDDRNLRTVFFVCRNIHDFWDDVFVPTDHPTEHHVFAWRRVRDQSSSNPSEKLPELGRGGASLQKKAEAQL